uniref:Tyrosine kinase n=1 Tax=Spotted knifejaw iridovirus TaxID=655341 RepID=A0A8F9WIW0_ISKNV|nr:tyrosine kinase [Spotted knifejaw iridovirus]
MYTARWPTPSLMMHRSSLTSVCSPIFIYTPHLGHPNEVLMPAASATRRWRAPHSTRPWSPSMSRTPVRPGLSSAAAVAVPGHIGPWLPALCLVASGHKRRRNVFEYCKCFVDTGCPCIYTMIVYTDRDFLANLEYGPTDREVRRDGMYECTYDTLCATYNYLCTRLPEFFFVQVRHGEPVTMLHIKNRGYYNKALENIDKGDMPSDVPHPTYWFVTDGHVHFVDNVIVRQDHTLWFEYIADVCRAFKVADVDFFINPYAKPCVYDHMLLPVLTPYHCNPGLYQDIPVLLPPGHNLNISVKPSLVGTAMWIGCMTTDAAMGLADYEDGHSLVICNTSPCDRPLLLHDRVYVNAHKRAVRVDSCDTLPPFDYMVHVCDTVDKYTLLDKFMYINVPVLIVGTCSIGLIRPWQHFVPVSATLHDLADGIEWCRSHPKECATMVAAVSSMCRERLFERTLSDTLNATAAQCRRTHIINPLYHMARWQHEYMSVNTHRTDTDSIEPFGAHSLSNIDMSRKSYAFARGIQDMLSHKAFSYDQHCRVDKRTRMPFSTGNGDMIIDYTATVNGISIAARAYKRVDHLIRDYVFSRLCTNPLRRHCANFQYVYSVITAVDGSMRVLCEDVQGPTLAQWICSTAFTWETLLNVLARLVLALDYAFAEKSFMHYDMTAHTVVIVKDPDDVEVHHTHGRSYVLPTIGIRPVIKHMGNAAGAVFHAGYGGVMRHCTHDMFNPTMRQCLDTVTLVVSCLDVAREYGHDTGPYSLLLYDEFFGYKVCFMSKVGPYGALWRHISSEHRLQDYATYVVQNVLKVAPVAHAPNPYVRIGYYKYVSMCARYGVGTLSAWKGTLDELERTAIPPSNSMLHNAHQRCCVLLGSWFPFVDNRVPPKLRSRWQHIRGMLLDSMPVKPVPMHAQKNDAYCRLLEGTSNTNVAMINWLLCIETANDMSRCPPPDAPFHAVIMTETHDTGMLLHQVGCGNLVNHLEN